MLSLVSFSIFFLESATAAIVSLKGSLTFALMVMMLITFPLHLTFPHLSPSSVCMTLPLVELARLQNCDTGLSKKHFVKLPVSDVLYRSVI